MAGTQTGVVKSFTINGVDARDWGVEVIGIEGRGLAAEVIAREFRFPDEGGAPRQYGDLPGVLTHRLSGYVVGTNIADCRMKYEDFLLNIGLPIDIEQQLIIRSVKSQMHVLTYWDEPHKEWRVLYSGGHTRRELKPEQWKIGKYLFFTVEFKVPDVYAYGDKVLRTLALSSTAHFLNVPTGSAPSRPRVIFKNNTGDDITTLDIVGGKYAFNSPFNDMDSGGYPKGRGIKNDQWFTGDFGTIYYQTGKLNQGIALSGGIVQSDTCWYYNRVDEATPTGAINARINANQGTVAMWVKASKNWDDDKKWYCWDAGNSGLHIIKDTDNYLKIYDAASGNNSTLDVSAYLAGTWYLIIGWWDDNGASTLLQIFAGASSLSSGSAITDYDPTTPGQKAYIGSDINGDYPCNAVIDDFRIYKRALTSAERDEIINSGSGTTAPLYPEDLIAYFHLDGTAGSDVGSTVYGSQHHRRLDVSAISAGGTEATLTVAAGGGIFNDNDRVFVGDETGFGKYGLVDGTPSGTSLDVDDGAGAAISGIATVGVSIDCDSTYFASGGNIHDITTEDIGIAGWVNIESSSGRYSHIIGKAPAGTNPSYRCFADNGLIQLHINDGVDNYSVRSNTDIRDDKWHHFAIIIDRDNAANCKVYLDGYEDGTTNKVGTLGDVGSLTNAGSFYLGRSNVANSYYYLKGKVRDVVLSYPADIMAANEMGASGEILTLATNPLTSGSYCNYEDYWACTDNTGTTVTGANNNLALSNSAAWSQEAFITKNLVPDNGVNGGIGAVSNIGTNVTVTKSTSVLKYSRSWKAVWASANDNEEFTIAAETLANGEDRKYAFWVYVDSIDGSSNLHFDVDGSANVVTRQLDSGTDDHGTSYAVDTWLYFEGCYSGDQNGTHNLNFRVTGAGAGANAATIYVVFLYDLPNLIDNGECEATTSWNSVGTPSTFAVVATPHTGTNGLRVVADADNEGAETDALTLEANQYYEVSGFFRGASGAESIIFSVQGYDSATGTTSRTITATTTYTRYSFVFRTASDTSGTIRITCTNGDDIYFDDISIHKCENIDATLTALGAGSHFVPAREGKGFQTAADLLVYGVVGNPNQWACVWRGRPQFADDIAEDVTLFEHYFSADDYMRLFYDASEDKYTFRKTTGSTDYDATSKAMDFEMDEEIEITCTFDTTNGSQIYINGSSTGSTAQSDTNALGTGTTNEQGTAQAGTSTTITLASGASASDDNYNSYVIEITGGTGAGQQRLITDYVGSTKVATVNNAWTTTPDSTSTYLLYSSTLTLGGTTGGLQLANIITDELVIFTHKLTANEVMIIYTRAQPLWNHNGAIKLSATISSDDFVEIDCDDLDIEQMDASANDRVSLLSNGITTNNSRFFQLHPGETLDDGDIIWCENASGELEVRYDLRFV